MRLRALPLVVVGLTLAFPAALVAADGPALAEWEIHDSLGHQWTAELLHYRLDLRTPVAAGHLLAVTDGDGRAVSAQVLDRTTNAAGQITRVVLALQTDLSPFVQRRFRLHAASPADAPADLVVDKQADRWVLRTSKIGVAIPAGGETFAEGKTFRDVPAPILALRGATADWVGKGWLTGNRKVVAWKSEIRATGPVLAWARVSYDLGGGQTYVVDVRVPAGQPVVLVREERNLPDVTAYETDPAKGDVFHLALAPGLKPTHVYSKRGITSTGSFIEPGPAFKGTYLTPAQMHYVPASCNIVATWKEGGDQAPVVGLFPRFLSHWDRPHHTFVPLAWDADQGLVARFFLKHGNRAWALMAGGKKELLTPRGQGGEHIGGYFGALLLANQWGETPLDKVKDWVLDWGQIRYQPGTKYAYPNRGRGLMPYFAEQFILGGQKWHDTYIHVHQTWTGEGDSWPQFVESLKTTSTEQKLALRAAAAFVEYKQTDPDYWPAGNWIGPANPNMIDAGNSAILKGALALRDHPKAKEWAKIGTEAVRASLYRSSSKDGAWIECPGYEGVGSLMLAAIELHKSGLGDLISDGRLLQVALNHAHLVTPPDPRVNGVRHLPEYGDCFNLQTDKNAERARPTYWKRLVPLLEKTHPREAGQILWALGEKEGPVPVVPFEGKSRQIAGFGAVYRHAFNTPAESYLAVHQDSFGFGHYHFDLGALYLFGKGAPLCVDWPSLYSPQVTEPWMHNCVSIGRQKRYTYRGHVKNAALTPAADYSRARVYYDTAFPPKDDVPDDGAGGDLPPHCWQRQVLWVKGPEPTGTAYAVVRDGVSDTRPTDWNLWTLSNKLRLTKRRAEAMGTYGVNLTVAFFAGPDETPTTELFGFGAAPADVGKPLAAPEPKRSEPAPGVLEVETPRRFLMQQNVVRLAMKEGGQYGAVLYPHRPAEAAPTIAAGREESVTVAAEGHEDAIFLYPAERTVKVGGVTFTGRAAVVGRAGGRVHLQFVEGTRLQSADGPGVRGNGPVSVAEIEKGLAVWTDGAARELEIVLPAGIQGQLAGGEGVTLLKSQAGAVTVRVTAGPRQFQVK